MTKVWLASGPGRVTLRIVHHKIVLSKGQWISKLICHSNVLITYYVVPAFLSGRSRLLRSQGDLN